MEIREASDIRNPEKPRKTERAIAVAHSLELLRQKRPLVHNITNFVVMNNTANALLAVGAAPVMAHALEEVEEMVGIADALVLNIGTLSPRWVESMLAAGQAAKQKNIPIVLDPVGAGATKYRTQTCLKILQSCCPTIIRGNASEIVALRGASTTSTRTRGVDSSMDSAEGQRAAWELSMELAAEMRAVVVTSGASDYITDGKSSVTVANGTALMTQVTGLGCTASALCAAFAASAVSAADAMPACVSAMAVMGIGGEIAAEQACGPGTLQLHFLDALSRMNSADIQKYCKSE